MYEWADVQCASTVASSTQTCSLTAPPVGHGPLLPYWCLYMLPCMHVCRIGEKKKEKDIPLYGRPVSYTPQAHAACILTYAGAGGQQAACFLAHCLWGESWARLQRVCVPEEPGFRPELGLTLGLLLSVIPQLASLSSGYNPPHANPTHDSFPTAQPPVPLCMQHS